MSNPNIGKEARKGGLARKSRRKLSYKSRLALEWHRDLDREYDLAVTKERTSSEVLVKNA